MKKLLFIILALIALSAKAQFCQTYTAHAPINYVNAGNLTISGDSINCASANGITLTNCHDIRITRCRLTNGDSTHYAIYLFNCYNITADSNYVDNVKTGFNAVSCPLGGIVIMRNYGKNMQAITSGTTSGGQMVQFNQVNGPGNKILFNKLEDFDGQSRPEDGISLYKSNGTFDSRIEVAYNWIRRHNPTPRSGSGIMSGDNEGAFEYIHDNIIVSPGNCGIGIAGGTNITVRNNTIYSPAHPGHTVANVALNLANYTPTLSGVSTTCNTDTVTGNHVSWWSDRNYDGTHSYTAVNNVYNPGSCTITMGANTFADGALNSSILPTALLSCGMPNISYSPSSYHFGNGTTIPLLVPVSSGSSPTFYAISPNLTTNTGLTFNTVTGVISGIASISDTLISYRVIASNLSGSDTTHVSISVASVSAPIISYSTPHSYTKGTAITPLSPTSTGGAVTSYSATLSAGLSINSSSGVISGTPAAAAPLSTYFVSATNAGGTRSFGINITVASNMIFGPVATRTYGAADFDPGAVSGSSITYTSDNTAVATIVDGQVHIVGAGTASITASSGGTSVSRLVTIAKAPLKITADSKSKTAGTANPTLTVTYSGFVLDQNISVLSVRPSIGTSANSGSPVGHYPITVGGASASNYVITYAGDFLNVTNP